MNNTSQQGNRPQKKGYKLPLLVFFLINLLQSGNLFSQTPIIIINQLANRDILVNGAGDPWGGYVLAGTQVTSSPTATLLRLRSDGDTLFRRFEDVPKSVLEGVISTGEDKFLAYGSIAVDTVPPLEQYKHFLWILNIDTGLNILAEHFYAMPQKYLTVTFMNGMRENSGNFIFCALAGGDYSDNAHKSDYVMMRLTSVGDSLKIRYIDVGYDDRDVCLGASQDGDSLFLFGEIGQAIGSIQGVHYLDNAFNYLGNCPKYFDGFFSPYAVKRFDADKLLLNGVNTTPNNLFNRITGVCWLNNQADEYSSFQCQPDTLFCNNLSERGMDFIKKNEIYIGGNKDMHVPWDYFSPTSYFLALFDSNLIQQSSWFFGGDSRYNLNSVIASPAGGSIMVGSRVIDAFQGLTNAYLVMIPAPVVTNLPEPIATDDGLRLSPNPGNDWLKIESNGKDQLVFELYDINGRCFRSLPLDAARVNIYTADLPCGLYCYSATSRGGKSFSGKWIKQ